MSNVDPAIDAAARRTSILAKNTTAALLLARGKLFPTAAVADAVPSPPPRRATLPPNNMLIVTSLLKPDAAARLPRQHHVCRPMPATALTPRQYRWCRRPHRDGSTDLSRWCRRCPPVALVALAFLALASSSSALVWGATTILFSPVCLVKKYCSAPS